MKQMLSGILWASLMIGLIQTFLLRETRAFDTVKLYYEENAQVELASPSGSRILIDVHDPSALSCPPTATDILLTTHNHGDHRRLHFVKSFPGRQIDVKTGEINLEGVNVRSIASAHNEGDELREEGGSNYIFIVEMAGLRFAHFGDIGQEALSAGQLKALGKVDVAIMQLSNPHSDMTAANQKGFRLMAQVNPKLIIPTHVFDPACANMATKKWDAYESYKKALDLSSDNMPGKPTIVFMGRNADLVKLDYFKR